MTFLRNTWYVAAWAHEVTDLLFHRKILNESILVYRKQDGTPVAIANYCPHRFAPLHRGRLKGDHVECGYHGLQFDESGACVHNPHGNHTIPKACRIKAYPLEERHGVLWIWPGDPALADPSAIPDFGYLTEAGRKTVHGYAMVRANYQLINDNLIDASHTQFVHQDLLGTEAFTRSKHEVVQDGRSVHSNYVIPDSDVPAAYRPYFKDPEQRVDYSVNFHWRPASVVRNAVFLTPVGRPIEEGIQRTGTHLMTPETGVTTHYFFAHTRNFDLNDPRVDARIRRWQQNGLTDQDGAMIEAVQEAMGTADLESLHPVLLSIDAAAARVRRVLDAAIKDEETSSAPLAGALA